VKLRSFCALQKACHCRLGGNGRIARFSYRSDD
jgi:hypothetical protein